MIDNTNGGDEDGDSEGGDEEETRTSEKISRKQLNSPVNDLLSRPR